MRRYIRHPSDIPISFSVGSASDSAEAPRLRNVGLGGLCFSSDIPWQSGAPIHIEIPVSDEDFVADGVVVWCRKEGGRYCVGVDFRDQSTQFSIRMVEQLCHIEHYRAEVLRAEGRALTSEEAAKEWIKKYAANFPD
ncbi:MAG: PilZ domain-containing protein [Pseudohongiellaceae bacterium]